MVADSLGKLPRPARVLAQTYTVEPAQDGERFVTLRRVGQGQNLIVAYHTVSAAHPDAAAVQVLAAVAAAVADVAVAAARRKDGWPRRWSTPSSRTRRRWASSSSTIPAWCRSRRR